MSILEISAVLLTLASFFGYINFRFIKLPQTVGLVVISLFVSFGAMGLHIIHPSWHIAENITEFLNDLDFNKFLMQGILSLLLFAGALHVHIDALIERKWTILCLSSLGVIISTFLMGTAFFCLAQWIGLSMPYIVALVFGALISPTDPVAVLALFKKIKLPSSLEVTITGESLFNDGVGVVVYTILVGLAFAASGHYETAEVTFLSVTTLFFTEAIGGAILGLLTGYFVFLLMRTIDEYVLEIMMTLALVTGTYSIALNIHVSGPIAMVAAGLVIGNTGTKFAMSESTRRHLTDFWKLTDEILNSVLFILIGFEILVITETTLLLLLSLMMIPVSLLSRAISVSIPLAILRPFTQYSKGIVPILTAAGLKGGISVALALALPASPYKATILAVTYALVIFSILVQGLTVEKVIRHYHPNK